MGFKKIDNGAAIIYQLDSTLNLETAETIIADVRQELKSSKNFENIVFNLEANGMDHKVFKAITPLGIDLRKLNKKIFALTENKMIHNMIRDAGMDMIIKPIMDISETASKVISSHAPKKLDVSFINPFIDGTMHVLNIQCKTKAVPGKPLLKGDQSFKCPVDIAGIIGINSKSFQGSIALCFPAPVFLLLMSQMLGEEVPEITDELKDGAGEMLNMIFGHAKKILNENGHTIDRALPSVIRGPNIQIDHTGSQESIILPFTIDKLTFFIEIGRSPN